jgi:hypothetical protein
VEAFDDCDVRVKCLFRPPITATDRAADASAGAVRLSGLGERGEAWGGIGLGSRERG